MKPGSFCTSTLTDMLVPQLVASLDNEEFCLTFNPLNPELNSVCHLLALLRAHPILHISRIRVKNRASYI